jgi:glycosyltransferase involved in cell wall biosynthesis
MIRSAQYDVIVPVLEGPALAVALARIGGGEKAPVIVSIQNAFLRVLRESPSRKAHFLHHLWCRAYAAADGAIALSHGVARDLEQYVPKLRGRTRTVHNVGLVAVPPLPERGRPADAPIALVACGRLDPVKDYPTMLRAVAKVLAVREVELHILGEGPCREELERLAASLEIAEHVTFHGFVSQPERIMQTGDLFILSSISEGFGNVIVEAMALGIPVVATDCPYGPGEILAEGQYGRLVPVAKPDELAEAIIELIDAPEERSRLAKAGRQRAADFTPERIGQQFLDALLSLAGASGRTSEPEAQS